MIDSGEWKILLGVVLDHTPSARLGANDRPESGDISPVKNVNGSDFRERRVSGRSGGVSPARPPNFGMCQIGQNESLADVCIKYGAIYKPSRMIPRVKVFDAYGIGALIDGGPRDIRRNSNPFDSGRWLDHSLNRRPP